MLVLTAAWLCLPVDSQAALIGRVLAPDGAAISNAPVRLRDESAGLDLQARSAEDGRYEFPDVPPGTYRVTINMPCCLYNPYANDAVEVGGAAAELDIRMTFYNIPIEGDEQITLNSELRNQRATLDLPVPRMPGGQPDFSGIWLPSDDPYPDEAHLQDWATDVMAERAANFYIDLPSAHCLPGSPPVPSSAGLIARFVQRPEVLVILFEDLPGFRQIYLDGREFPENLSPTWMGYSVGRWEGDTLVVDTVGFNERGWTEAFPRSTMMQMEERYTRTSFGRLDVVVTYDDPGVFTEPLTRRMTWDLGPDVDIFEYVCENNQWMDVTASDVGFDP